MSTDSKSPGTAFHFEHQLDAIFTPRNVAVIGATDRAGSVGRTVLGNLIRSPFGGTVFPVSRGRTSVLGLEAFPNIDAVPDTVDLAVIVTPAAGVPDVVRQCVNAGTRAAVIVSAGFRETGEAGARLEQRILEEARRGSMRIVGPNCLGVMSPITGLNATFAPSMALPGTVGFISQSGALCTAVLDWSLRENVGFSHFVSIGSMLDVGWGDLIDYLGDDDHTDSIVIYMESIGDARAFMTAAREVALTKPIIVIKAGRTRAAANAAALHTGALSGSDLVLDAAFRRSGVLRVETIAELFYMAEVLAKQPRPAGPRLTIVTNAGGPGVLATDSLIGSRGELALLPDTTREELDRLLPPHWSHNNPVDLLGDASPERYAQAVAIAAANDHSDGLLVILTPQAMTDPTGTAEALKVQVKNINQPVIASWMGGADVAAGQSILVQANIPAFPYPDTAARIFTHMWRYSENLRGLYETPSVSVSAQAGDGNARRITDLLIAARSAGRTVLTDLETKQVLAAYAIPAIDTPGTAAARAAVDGYELAVGSEVDPQFGPVLLFGLGGRLGRAYEDRVLGLPPLNTTLARRMMEQTKVFAALRGASEGAPCDIEALEQLLVRFSQLIVDHPTVKEAEINPLLASASGLVALEARIVLHDPQVPDEELPTLAIHPYPIQHVGRWTLKNGAEVTIRPIRPEDEPLLARFHRTVSERSVYFRYLHLIGLNQRIAHERLTRVCFIDYARDMALVVEQHDAETPAVILAVGRLMRIRGTNEAEFAILVADAVQRQGLGTELLRRLVQIGRDQKLTRIVANIDLDNRDMQIIAERIGFSVAYDRHEDLMKAGLDL
jgi:acetyltransferase